MNLQFDDSGAMNKDKWIKWNITESESICAIASRKKMYLWGKNKDLNKFSHNILTSSHREDDRKDAWICKQCLKLFKN